MQCPVDDAVLQRIERQGVEIDYCPQCRGVWLDRGELDKLIERSCTFEPASAHSSDRGLRDYERYADGTQYSKKKIKESFLGDVFDF
jgi:Zn-finger nucleic acid-binding protein